MMALPVIGIFNIAFQYGPKQRGDQGMGSDPQGSIQGDASSAPPKKSRKILAAAAVIVVIILIGAVVGFMFLNHEHFAFTTFKGTTITTMHYSSGSQTITGHSQWNSSYQWEVGEPMMFRQQMFNWKGNGTMSLVGVTCGVPGFTFLRSSPGLTVVLPKVSSQAEGVWVDLWFDTPTSNYNGPFLYTLNVDWYPPTPIQSTLTFVKENQIIKTHDVTGVITKTYEIEQTNLTGKYTTGAPITFNEYYMHNGTYTENITKIEANTSGFSFLGSLPALPVAVPNASQPMLMLSMVFSTPGTIYNGTFAYTIYIERYMPYQPPVPQYNNLTAVREVQYVTSHFGSASNTVRYVHWHNETTGHYPVGRTMNITEPYWNIGTGNLSIASIVCNTTGFSLIGVSSSLPVHVPNSPGASSGNVTLVMSFSVPATQYIGEFEYIVYFDSYVV
jgi:hypothetical protein